jgi:hypothetical protein
MPGSQKVVMATGRKKRETGGIGFLDVNGCYKFGNETSVGAELAEVHYGEMGFDRVR